MRILIALTYYRPYYSGLTIYAHRLAKALAKRGHQVTVITSQFLQGLPLEETMDGIRVVRVPVVMKISKGFLMPAFIFKAWDLIKNADVINLHLPQLDAAPIAFVSRLLNKRVVSTYHCDLVLPSAWVHRLANIISNIANHISVSISDLVITNTKDYAENSRFLRKYLKKVHVIPPPIEVADCSADDISKFQNKYGIEKKGEILSVVGRFAAEKGIETIIKAMPLILKKYPGARILYAGQHEEVKGEEAYAQRLMPLIQGLASHWKFLGILPDEELAALFHISNALIVASTNSTESFGMVQYEAMICGTPVVASDIPGLRQGILTTGMGKLFSPGDADSLADAAVEMLENPDHFKKNSATILEKYSPDQIASEYEGLINET